MSQPLDALLSRARRLPGLLGSLPQLPLGIGLALIGLLIGTLSLSQGLQSQMARHLTDKLLSSEKLSIREKVDRFDTTLRHAEQSVVRYAALISSERDPICRPAPELPSWGRRSRRGCRCLNRLMRC